MTPTSEPGEFLSGFLAEAEDLLAAATHSLLALEASVRKGVPNARAVRDAFRVLHTVKGLSAMVGIEPIVAIAHRMESVLRLADQAAGRIALPAVDALLHGAAAIGQRVRALAASAPVPAPPEALLAALDALVAGQAASAIELEPALLARLGAPEHEHLAQGLAEGRPLLRVDFAPGPQRAAEGLNITTVRERFGAVAEIVKVLPRAVPASAEAPGGLSFSLILIGTAPLAEIEKVAAGCGAKLTVAGGRPAAPPVEPSFAALEEPDELEGHRGTNVVRVEVPRLDDVMDGLSALIVTRFRLARAVAGLAARGADVRELLQIVAENARQLRDLRAAVVRVRMVKLAEILARVPLLVSGLRRQAGRQVALSIDAGAVEIDKAVGERLFPAIVHLIRNAVDHAIEPSADRVAAGKPPGGLLQVSCSERANTQLELVISDDGRGIDSAEIARRAGSPVPQGDAELLELICRPGFSTRDRATTTSGRGMGMDIVRRITVDELGGELSMTSVRGSGTTFRLRVPLTITIIDAFSFECAGERFVVPVSMVDEIIEIDPAAVIHAPSRAADRCRPGMIERRGATVPLLELGAIFGLHETAPARRALVVRRGGAAMAFAVHRMLGQQEIVVRPLEDVLVKAPFVSGATDLGDGKPTLVLDLVALGTGVLQPRSAA